MPSRTEPRSDLPTARVDAGFQKLLLQLSELAARGGDFDAAIAEFCASIRAFFKASGAYFWSVTPEGTVVGTYADGHFADRFVGRRRPLDETSVVGRALQERQAVYLNDIDSTQYPMAGEFHARAIMAVPIILAGEAVGCIALIHTAEQQFTPDLADKATIVAAAFGAVLETARLADASREENRRAQALLLCAKAMQASLKGEEVMQALADHLLRLLRARFVAVGWEGTAKAVACDSEAFAAEVRLRLAEQSSPWLDNLLRGACDSAAPTLAALEPGGDALAQWVASPQAITAPLRTASGRGALLVCSSPEQIFGESETALVAAVADFAALAIANSELYSRASTQSNELQQLLQIAAELGGTRKLDKFLQQFVIRSTEFLGFERSFVALNEPDGCHVRWTAAEGKAQQLDFKMHTRNTERLLATGEPYWCDDARKDSELDLPLVKEHQVRQYLAVPLMGSTGEALGLFGMFNRQDGAAIGEQDVRRAQALAAEAAVALEAARNLHRSEEHRRRAESLMSLALELNSSLGMPDFVRGFTVRACDMLGARAAALALAHGSVLETVILHDAQHAPDKQLMRRLNLALSDLAVSRHESVSCGPAPELLGPTLAAALGWSDVTVARLIGSDEELLGIVCLADRGELLTSADRNLLQALCGHASVALENARLFARIAQSNKQWAEIFDAITDFIVVHDEQHKVLRVNRSLADFIGIRPSELIGVGMRALVAMATDPGGQACPFCRAGQDRDDEYVHQVVDRTYIVSTSRIHGTLHEGIQTIHILKDITDRREAERRYRELFDNIQEGLYFSTPEGRFVEVNEALVRMLGYESRDEVLQIDLPSQLYASPEDRMHFAQAIEATGVLRNYEETLRRKDGSLVHTLQNAFALRDEHGRTVQYRGLMLDITELKAFQAQLVRERDFNSKILENTQSLIVVLDTAGQITYANRRSFEAGVYREDQLLGHKLVDHIAPGRRTDFDFAFQSTLGGQQVDNIELHLVRGNGTTGHFSVNLSPMRDEQGSVNSIVLVMTDITEASVLQAKLMHTEKMAAVGQLVSGVAHEVNNPLTAILGFSDLLLEQHDLSETARKDVRVIVQEAQRTKTIVQNLLSFARQVPPQRQPVELNALLRRTVQLRAYDFANHGIEVTERLTEPLPAVIGDAHQLQQVFLNILNNAYDAVRDSQRRGVIEIGSEVGENCVTVSFRDNGPGVVHPERIFDPFFTTKEVGKGTGLGLSICYGIVREHGGEIMAENNLEHPGATFTVRLPMASAAAAAAGGAR